MTIHSISTLVLASIGRAGDTSVWGRQSVARGWVGKNELH